jgi:hypothetical protein
MRRRRYAPRRIWIVRLDPRPDEAAEEVGDPDKPNTGGHGEQPPGDGLGHLVTYNAEECQGGGFLRRFTEALPTRKRFVADALVDQCQAVAELRQPVKSR